MALQGLIVFFHFSSVFFSSIFLSPYYFILFSIIITPVSTIPPALFNI
jgi:hypothetical protein